VALTLPVQETLFRESIPTFHVSPPCEDDYFQDISVIG